MYYLLLLAAIALAPTSGMVGAQDRSFGDRLYHEKADCQFCHGIDGDGRGDPRSLFLLACLWYIVPMVLRAREGGR